MSEQPEIYSRQIAMGHGLVDVTVGLLNGRYGLVLRERDEYIPVGEQTSEQGSLVLLDEKAVVIWLDGPEFGDTIINALNEAAAIKANNNVL